MSDTQMTALRSEAAEDQHAFPRLVCLPAGVVTIYFIVNPWPVDHWAVNAIWTLGTAYFLFCWTSCFHETVHQTLTRSKPVSVWLGRFLGTMIFVPYTVYRESHIRHHAYLNKPYDWELWPYASPDCSKAFRRVFVWFDLFCGWITGPYIYGQIFFHKQSPLRNPAIRRTIRNEYLFIVFYWGALLGFVQLFEGWVLFAKVWVVPTLIGAVLQTGRKLTEHLGMSSFDPMLGTRTVLGSNWITRLGTYVNFDIFIHGPHHRHPRVAHNQLGRKMHDYMAENPHTTYPVYRHYWQATWAMLPFLFRNPGCGVNAGGEAPVRRDDDVQDFVVDVSREILTR